MSAISLPNSLPNSISPRGFSLGLAFALLLCFVSNSVFADKVTPIEGKGRALTGTIILVNNEKVTIDVRGEKQDIAANIISSTVYEGEPPQLNTVRNAVVGSRYTEAIESLAKVDPKTFSGANATNIKQDYDYFLAASKARIVLSGSGDAADAEKELVAFLKNNDKSYHYYEICELYGDLMLQQGQFDKAKKSYAVLAKAPWPEYNLKATTSLGMAEITENKIDSARKNFETVIKSDDTSEVAEKQKGIAKIGLAQCLIADKKYDEAVKAIEAITKEASTGDSSYQSILYNSLGDAYDKAGNPKAAILAYLHTDILFSSARNEHIKALQALVRLQKKTQRPERAEEAEKRLKTLYNIAAK